MQPEPQPAENPGGRARRAIADQKNASQGHTAVAASKAATTQSDIIGGAAQQQQTPAGHATNSGTAAVVGLSAPAGTKASDAPLPPPAILNAPKQLQPSMNTVQPEPPLADPLAAVPATAQADTPDKSFDGRQSFISLDVDDAPAGGAASVDQPSPASRKTKLIPGSDSSQAVSAQLPAAPASTAQQGDSMDVDISSPTDATQSPQRQPRQQQPGAAGSAVTNAAETEADKRDIKPDLFTASRPSSAVSTGAGALKFDAEQKQLPAAKSKVAAKGNIQIVLATKHKEVCLLHCADFPLVIVWTILPVVQFALLYSGLPVRLTTLARRPLPL